MEENQKSHFYNPANAYEWKGDEEFPLTGKELEYMFNNLTEFLTLPSSQAVLKALETHKILQQKIAQGVDKGSVIVKQGE